MDDAMGGNVVDCEAKQILRQGIAQGIEQGIEQGAEKKLIEQICRKMAKGKAVNRIAEDLEEEPDHIHRIYQVALKYAPEYNTEKILAELTGQM